ncbi:hypothetical protein FOC4_g10008300 [Fusarium odoratissimum]|uniref:Uncharacterized protein n=1 Tax=Fusarium oxysporum f. sp. cubense (strain race 4) TaxID=2502994 RepID=N1RT96_FUSC4|nr:hypothetical protein FOC4_g10008300 [Fusarium odoratissimum]
MATSENSSQSGSRTRVIVGLDIGTTFSGISYAVLTQNPDRPTSFWWEVDGKKSQKIPTKIEVSEIPIEWFKLSLLHRDDLPSDVRNSPKFIKLNNTREAMNITAVNATADYISKIWNVFRDKLQKRIPDPYIQITVTVPVVWPRNARQKMNEALHEARILNENVVLAPKFLAEPEAAALAFFSAAYYLQETQARTTFYNLGHLFMLNTPLDLQTSTWTCCHRLRLWRRYRCKFSVTLPKLPCLVLIPPQGHGRL